MEIETGKFEHGGVKLVKMYLYSENRPAPKKLAYKTKCIEYDSAGKVLSEHEITMLQKVYRMVKWSSYTNAYTGSQPPNSSPQKLIIIFLQLYDTW